MIYLILFDEFNTAFCRVLVFLFFANNFYWGEKV